MFRDPGTTGPHRLKKWKDRSALVPVLAVLAGQRANFPNASGFVCRNPATTPAQRTGWAMRREPIPPAAISFSPHGPSCPVRGLPARRLHCGFPWRFGLPALAAGRHWGLPLDRLSFALSLSTGPQVPFSDKRRAFLRPSRGVGLAVWGTGFRGRSGGLWAAFPGLPKPWVNC